MGLFDRKRTIETVAVTRGADVAAQIGPAPTLDAFYPFGGADYLASREEAMSVPAIARARNMICNSIATIPLITRDKTQVKLLINLLSFLIQTSGFRELHHGYGRARIYFLRDFSYFQIMSLFADTGRVREMWRVAPNRVGVFLNDKGTQIEYYTVDGMQVPNGSVVGGLIVFYGNDEGLLNRAGSTIRAGCGAGTRGSNVRARTGAIDGFEIKWHSVAS
jgi:hypothetical protein